MFKWNNAIFLDKQTLCNMLSVPEQKDASHLWKMNAIQLIALACTFDVSIADSSQVN